MADYVRARITAAKVGVGLALSGLVAHHDAFGGVAWMTDRGHDEVDARARACHGFPVVELDEPEVGPFLVPAPRADHVEPGLAERVDAHAPEGALRPDHQHRRSPRQTASRLAQRHPNLARMTDL
jgi:hypothetical protein